MKSYRLGAARILADYYQEDPISNNTILNLHQLFENSLPDLFEAIKTHQPKELIGTAGSFDSFTELTAYQKNENYVLDQLRVYPFNFDDYIALLEKIIQSTHAERLSWKGLIPLRVDMILMASILTKYVLNASKIKAVTACTYSLKEGLLLSDF
jgi:exopolyphosphatase/guanosine-5'-triphosphate,3'-diphosphate pyrophosphatase